MKATQSRRSETWVRLPEPVEADLVEHLSECDDSVVIGCGEVNAEIGLAGKPIPEEPGTGTPQVVDLIARIMGRRASGEN